MALTGFDQLKILGLTVQPKTASLKKEGPNPEKFCVCVAEKVKYAL